MVQEWFFFALYLFSFTHKVYIKGHEKKIDGLIIPNKISSRKNEERQHLDNDQNFFRIKKKYAFFI